MKNLALLGLVLTLMNVSFAQDLKSLIADGTADSSIKYALQPQVEQLSAEELNEVKKEAVSREIDFDSDKKSSDESVFNRDFELLDVADGFFISREIKYRVYLYTAWSAKIKRNYQGVIILKRYTTGLGEKRTDVTAHYAYEFCGDKFISRIADMNGNILDEIAIISYPPTRKIQKAHVRILEFSPTGLKNVGSYEIYSRENRPNYIPKDPKQKQLAQMPLIYAAKLFVEINSGSEPKFFAEKFKQLGNSWLKTEELKPVALESDQIKYLELVKPNFPKGVGER